MSDAERKLFERELVDNSELRDQLWGLGDVGVPVINPERTPLRSAP